MERNTIGPRWRGARAENKILRMEHKSDRILPRRLFVLRLLVSLSLGASLIVFSLLVGMAGYHHFEHMPWIDAYVNASMILSGMGPLAQLQSVGGKLFAGLYALYSGFAVLIIAAVAFAPVIHRMLHKLHADDLDGDKGPSPNIEGWGRRAASRKEA